MVGTGHYENFPVASVLLPADMRRHVTAVYAFARTADDYADEGTLAPEERLSLLDGWEARLHDACGGRAQAPVRHGEPPDTPSIFAQLGTTIRQKQIPVDLFAALLSAFRQDVTVHRYATWTALLDYCRRSANPVGRIVLRIAGYHDAARDRLSDAICTALQLTNFWQDLRIDWQRGRVYVPEEDMRAHAVNEAALDGAGLTPAWRALMRALVARTRSLFDLGRPLCDAVRGRLRFELRATWLGGVRILGQIATGRADVLVRRPTLSARDLPWIVSRMIAWPRGVRS